MGFRDRQFRVVLFQLLRVKAVQRKYFGITQAVDSGECKQLIDAGQSRLFIFDLCHPGARDQEFGIALCLGNGFAEKRDFARRDSQSAANLLESCSRVHEISS